MEVRDPPNVCFSGGAAGADYEFTDMSFRKGHTPRIMSFEGHNLSLPVYIPCNAVVVHTDAVLRQASDVLERARLRMNRPAATTRTTRCYLLRDTFQVKDADSVYAVGYRQQVDSTDPYAVNIEGGTAYACQCFVDKKLDQGCGLTKDTPEAIPLYFFDQTREIWRQAFLDRQHLSWQDLEDNPPKPSGWYAGIGSRQLLDVGRMAIQTLYW